MTISTDGPQVGATDIRFRLRLPADGVRSVRLCQQVNRPRVGPPMVRTPLSTLWETRLDRPPVDRIEYQYEIEYVDGTRRRTLDPHNVLRAAGPFGEQSVLELPGYKPPDWLEHPAPVGGRHLELGLRSDVLDARMRVVLWVSPGLGFEHESPLLIVHDGPEYDEYSSLLRFLSAMVDADRLPPLRAVLLPPVERNDHYAASPRYAQALARELLPVLDWLAPQPAARYDGRSWRVGMGASLGALSILHVHRLYPEIFGGVFLQSGSFFQPDLDDLESGFGHFDRIAAFVSGVVERETWRHPIVAGLTCGTVEENLANNRRVRDALVRQGYEVVFAEHRDAHNWVGWRDAFDPHLVDVLQRAWRGI